MLALYGSIIDNWCYILVVRARAGSGELAYDAVSVEVSREPSPVPAEAGPEGMFELAGLRE